MMGYMGYIGYMGYMGWGFHDLFLFFVVFEICFRTWAMIFGGQYLWNDHFGTYGSLMVPILHSQVDQLTFLFSFRTKIRADRSSLWSEPSWLPPKCREDHERS